MSKLVRIAATIGVFVSIAGCSASKSGGAPPASASPSGNYPQQGYSQPGQPASAQAQPGAYPSPPPPPSPEPPATPSNEASGKVPAPAQPGGGAAGASSRSMALQSASNEIESSQRELDVAAGDCRNACRALGSMDRAAGKVCELAQGSEEGRRCDGAKQRVYSARDRVKTTCGSCPGGASVERTAPIPSLR